MTRPFVRVLGVALAVSGCEKGPSGPVTANPPPPEPVVVNPPPPEVVAEVGNEAPPASSGAEALPTWDSVESGHPQGATNPPYPVLVVTRDTQACYKAWRGGMVPPEPGVREVGGSVIENAAALPSRATQVQCPEGQPAKLLEAWASYEASGTKH